LYEVIILEKQKTTSKEKIVLPKNLQREIMRFFIEAATPKNVTNDKEQQQTPKNSCEGC